MKNIIRAFVAVLVLTGAVATTQTSSASTQNKVTAARDQHASCSLVRSRRSQRLRNGSRTLVRSHSHCDSLVSNFLHIRVINCCVRAWNTLG